MRSAMTWVLAVGTIGLSACAPARVNKAGVQATARAPESQQVVQKLERGVR